MTSLEPTPKPPLASEQDEYRREYYLDHLEGIIGDDQNNQKLVDEALSLFNPVKEGNFTAFEKRFPIVHNTANKAIAEIYGSPPYQYKSGDNPEPAFQEILNEWKQELTKEIVHHVHLNAEMLSRESVLFEYDYNQIYSDSSLKRAAYKQTNIKDMESYCSEHHYNGLPQWRKNIDACGHSYGDEIDLRYFDIKDFHRETLKRSRPSLAKQENEIKTFLENKATELTERLSSHLQRSHTAEQTTQFIHSLEDEMNNSSEAMDGKFRQFKEAYMLNIKADYHSRLGEFREQVNRLTSDMQEALKKLHNTHIDKHHQDLKKRSQGPRGR